MKTAKKVGLVLFFVVILFITGWYWINGGTEEIKGTGQFYSWLVLVGLGLLLLAMKLKFVKSPK